MVQTTLSLLNAILLIYSLYLLFRTAGHLKELSNLIFELKLSPSATQELETHRPEEQNIKVFEKKQPTTKEEDTIKELEKDLEF